ncbi:OLC1v1009045C1 [Oldenlandia corymbosa var. corymbosa]|uniref:Importin subunit alpha n=1 Tax=Oldenlandia corymbosa var. corymbosa TaxID=529605 RepID=A0AAV1DRA6_OLDCO|nr:OLC1v1009045C1 [Oldenlandia corymbosa var. corymbosa]
MSLRPNARNEARRNSYKVVVDAEEGRRKREDGMIEIRKNSREENLLKKRRNVVVPEDDYDYDQALVLNFAPPEKKNHQQKENLQDLLKWISSNDISLQLEATTGFRKLLSIERDPPVDEVIESGVVPWLVKFLTRDDHPELQFQAASALTNIASGTTDQTRALIDYGAVPIFVKLLISSPVDNVRELAVWALGNVAEDCSRFRDFVKGNSEPDFGQIKPVLPVLARLIHSDDEEVSTDACRALSYLSAGSNDKIQAVIDAGVCPRLVELLLQQQHPSSSVLIPALRAVGNIVTGNNRQTQVIIDKKQALSCLLMFLTQGYPKKIEKEACWIISNITAGTEEQIQTVIEAGIISPLVQMLLNSEFKIKKEAAYAISNATCGGNNEQIKFLVSQGCVKPLCDLLAICPDPGTLFVCLEALENILKVGEAEKYIGNADNVNAFAQMIYEVGGLDKIENLQNHDNSQIYEKAVKILDTYYIEDDDDQLPYGGDPSSPPRFGFMGGQVSVPSEGFNFGS